MEKDVAYTGATQFAGMPRTELRSRRIAEVCSFYDESVND